MIHTDQNTSTTPSTEYRSRHDHDDDRTMLIFVILVLAYFITRMLILPQSYDPVIIVAVFFMSIFLGFVSQPVYAYQEKSMKRRKLFYYMIALSMLVVGFLQIDSTSETNSIEDQDTDGVIMRAPLEPEGE